MKKLTIKQITAVIRRVPAKKFRIMELAPRLVDKKGKVDIVKAIDLQGELNLAIAEVTSYIKATRQATEALQYIGHRKPWEHEDNWDEGEED